MSKKLLSGLTWRRALKEFSPKPLRETWSIDPVLQAIRLAPSSFGITPYKVHCVSDPKILKRLEQATFEQTQVQQCQHLLVFAARNDAKPTLQEFYTASKIPAENAHVISGFLEDLDEEAFGNWAAQQTMIGLGFALAAAADLRIASCPMQGFDPNGVSKVLGIPKNQKPVVIMALGHDNFEELPFAKWRYPMKDIVTHYQPTSDANEDDV
jgi:nitroreductase / dihydropteridine reductase